MTGTSQVGSQVRRFTSLPDGVAQLSAEVSTLREDLAAMRADLVELARRLTDRPAIDGSVGSHPAGTEPSGATAARAGVDDPGGAEDVELLAERLAVLEDGLDEVGARLEGMTRDGVNLVSAQLQTLVQRVDELAARPSITAEELERALARVVEGRNAATER